MRTFYLTTLGVILVAALGSRLGAADLPVPWFLEECTPQQGARAVQLRQEMMKAGPESDIYVPIPFPRTEPDVVEDASYQLLESWSHYDEPTIPSDVKPLLSALEKAAVEYQVLDVTNWLPKHCPTRSYGKTDRLWLVRMVANEGSGEIARAVLNESGLLAHFGTAVSWAKNHSSPMPWVDPFEAARSAAAQLGGHAVGFQYVAVAGPTFECVDAMPCIAFRIGDRSYLYKSPSLYLVSTDRPGVQGVRMDEFMREGPKRKAAIAALRFPEYIITVGGVHIAVATPVKIPSPGRR